MRIEPPVKRHLLGAYPTHSTSPNLHRNFYSITPEMLEIVLLRFGLTKAEGVISPNRKAIEEGYADTCEKYVVWNLNKVESLLNSSGIKATRIPVNQDFTPPADPDKAFANFTTIGTYFNVSGNIVGRWVEALGYREANGLPTEYAVKSGVAQIGEIEVKTAGGKKKIPTSAWNVAILVPKLMEAGHPLDYSFEKTHKGKGKNSDVEVSGVDKRVQKIAEKVNAILPHPERRAEITGLIKGESDFILKKVDKLLGKEGFLSEKLYLKYVR